MSINADIDATCAALGYFDGSTYHIEKDTLMGLKHLIWILRRDNENHQYRIYIGKSNVLENDLLVMLVYHIEDAGMSDVLLRLLVNLTSPTLLLYREELPKDRSSRRNFMNLVEILQRYKSAFTNQSIWTVLGKRLQTVLEIDTGERGEEQGLLIERILVLIRNVLQVPANPDNERRADNDASLHDQVIWAIHQAGLLDLVLYIIGCEYENQYHLHALEIIFLVYREQKADSLADASLQRSDAEKYRDEQELMVARRREKTGLVTRPPPARHSRFGGTYVLQNVKSISDNDIVCHQSLERAWRMDFSREKNIQKRSFRIVKEVPVLERRSAFSVRLFLREFCIEILRSAYNPLIRQVRRALERNCTGHDDSYLLWAIRFFMEFNRLSGFQLQLVSESLTNQCCHWILTRIQHDMDMITSDKKNARQWAKRLHIAILAHREILLSLVALQKMKDEDSQALFKMLQNNICYVLEYREIVFSTLMNYNESHSTKAYLQDVVEMTHIFFKIMEHFCHGTVIVQNKQRNRRRPNKKRAPEKRTSDEDKIGNLEKWENIWVAISSGLSTMLTTEITLPEEEHPIPFDALSDKSLADQKDDCMVRVHQLLRQEKLEHAVILLRSARDIWPEDNCFGAMDDTPEMELLLLKDIFITDFGIVNEPEDNDPETENSDSEDEEGESHVTETNFSFNDFVQRLVNPRVVRACVIVLGDWQKLSNRILKSAVTILHRIGFECKKSTMLFQVSLFKIFQQVLDAPKERQFDEFRKLAQYTIRHFVSLAPTNPKIYAELFFYKHSREADDIEHGYDDDNGNQKHKGAWTEEQEDELRRLYMENQTNPATDEDVIDWILNNLIDGNRTRRGVLKKLKELGLIFKAPTKKSIKAAISVKMFTHEQDEILKNLYDQYRFEDDCLSNIMKSFDGKSNRVVINRMIQLGLIADRSEIVPIKKKSNRIQNPRNKIDNEPRIKTKVNTHRKKPIVPKKTSFPLNIPAVKIMIDELNETMRSVFDWLAESINDAADDMDDEPVDDDDAVPLVPYKSEQCDAFDNCNFKMLLLSLGLLAPADEMETFWRIPHTMTVNELKLRANILLGLDVPDTDIQLNNIDTDSDIELIEDADDGVKYPKSLNIRHQSLNNLMYNDSDDTEDNIRRNNENQSINQIGIDDDNDINSQVLRDRLATLIDSDDSDEADSNYFNATKETNKSQRKRIRPNTLMETSDEDETTHDESTTVKDGMDSQQIKSVRHHISSNGTTHVENVNGSMDSSEPNGSMKSIVTSSMTTSIGIQKRVRSDSESSNELSTMSRTSDHNDDEGETIILRNNKKQRRRIAIIDDDDE